MKIYLLDPKNRIPRNIIRWDRKLKLGIVTSKAKLEGVILIGNGTPDDIAISLISYHFKW